MIDMMDNYSGIIYEDYFKFCEAYGLSIQVSGDFYEIDNHTKQCHVLK